MTLDDRSPRAQIKLLVAAALFATVFVSACGASVQSLDSATIERAIAQSILRQHGLYATVACPSKVPRRAGHVFTCTARLDVGVYPLAVTEIDGGGKVRYQDEKPLVVLNIAKVQRAIQASVLSQRHVHATVSCPSEVLQRAGLVFRCAAVIDGGARRYPFVVSEVDDAGHVRYLGV